MGLDARASQAGVNVTSSRETLTGRLKATACDCGHSERRPIRPVLPPCAMPFAEEQTAVTADSSLGEGRQESGKGHSSSNRPTRSATADTSRI